jgi:SOS-response transcriptional repressor LexA
MTGIGPRIRARRERLGWTVQKLATLAGISGGFLSRLETGKSYYSAETITKLAGALGVSVDVLFANKSNVVDTAADWRRIPLPDYVQAGQWTGVNPALGDEEMRETVMTDLEHPPSSFALRIRGSSMEPEFKAGDVVVIDPTIQPRPGDFVVATDDGGEATFKQYRSAGINEHSVDVFELIPLNPLYAPMRSDRQQIAIVGVMVEHRRYRQPSLDWSRGSVWKSAAERDVSFPQSGRIESIERFRHGDDRTTDQPTTRCMRSPQCPSIVRSTRKTLKLFSPYLFRSKKSPAREAATLLLLVLFAPQLLPPRQSPVWVICCARFDTPLKAADHFPGAAVDTTLRHSRPRVLSVQLGSCE